MTKQALGCISKGFIKEFEIKFVATADMLPRKRVNLKDTWKTSMDAGEHTGVSSQIRTKLSDLAVWQARTGCCCPAALSSNDSKTMYL